MTIDQKKYDIKDN